MKPSAKPVSPPSPVEEPNIQLLVQSSVSHVEEPKSEVMVEDSDCDEEDDHNSVSSSVKEEPQTTNVPLAKKARKVVKKKGTE